MSTPNLPLPNRDLHLVGDHPALDLLNTLHREDAELVDSLQTDHDVLQWLTRVGWPVTRNPVMKPYTLLHTARTLREVVRTLVRERKAGKRVDLADFNAFLAESQSHLHVETQKNGRLELTRQWHQRTPEEILAPIAEAAAELLASGDFNLVRRCEDSECILWFYDRTRSHHRRWCSMSTCGNRNKVAAFRRRHRITI